MFALHDFLNTPLYENYGIIIHPHWFDIFTLSMQTNTNVSCNVDDDESCHHNNEDRFEKEQEDLLIFNKSIKKSIQWCKTYYLLNKYMILLKML
jgi:hypothetical protein